MAKNNRVTIAERLQKDFAQQNVADEKFDSEKHKGIDTFFQKTSEIPEEDIASIKEISDSKLNEKSISDNPEISVSSKSEISKEPPELISSMIKPKDEYVRHVTYLKKNQSDFIRETAKVMSRKYKQKVKESEIFRIAVDYLMKAVNYKK